MGLLVRPLVGSIKLTWGLVGVLFGGGVFGRTVFGLGEGVGCLCVVGYNGVGVVVGVGAGGMLVGGVKLGRVAGGGVALYRLASGSGCGVEPRLGAERMETGSTVGSEVFSISSLDLFSVANETGPTVMSKWDGWAVKFSWRPSIIVLSGRSCFSVYCWLVVSQSLTYPISR